MALLSGALVSGGFGAICPSIAGASRLGGHSVSVRERELDAQVVYGYRRCTSALPSSQAPLPGAEVLIRPAQGREITARLDSRGRFHVRLPATLPIKAWVVLQDRLLSVAPDETGAGPYHIPLGALVFHQKDRSLVLRRRFVITGDNFDGAANIWRVLHEGGLVAERVSPVHLPPVTARWTYGRDFSAGGSHYDSANQTIYVGSAGGTHDEWESWPLLHEYGHHLLSAVADPGPGASTEGIDHSLISVEENRPALPWSEGFAHAFAAIVLQDPVLHLNCQWKGDLSAHPVHPMPENQRLAQYNEGAIAGVIWGLADHFGNGNVRAGLKLFLAAVASYRHDGHPPQSIREVRDALILGGLEHASRDEFDTIDKIFAAQRIAWGLFVTLDYKDSVPDQGGSLGWQLQGPGAYAGCGYDPNTEGSYYGPDAERPFSWGIGKIVEGGLPYTWQDDCLMDGAIASCFCGGDTAQSGTFWLRFPYLADEGHLNGQYTLSATWTCNGRFDPQTGSDVPCTSSTKWHVAVDSGVWGSRADTQYGPFFTQHEGPQSWIRPEALPQGTIEDDLDLPKNQSVPVVAFDAFGHCTLLPSNQDCSV